MEKHYCSSYFKTHVFYCKIESFHLTQYNKIDEDEKIILFNKKPIKNKRMHSNGNVNIDKSMNKKKYMKLELDR